MYKKAPTSKQLKNTGCTCYFSYAWDEKENMRQLARVIIEIEVRLEDV